jgi:hypothetical protein
MVMKIIDRISGIINIVLFILFVTITGVTMAQEPDSFEFKAIVHNSSGEVVTSHNVSYRFSILMGDISGKLVYGETHNVTTDQFGSVNLTIGDGINKTGNFTTIPWDSDKFYLKVELDASGNSTYVDIGTMQMLLIPSIPVEPVSENSRIDVVEDELFIVRKFVGGFIDYRHTGHMANEGPNIIWIKTSMNDTYGKISAYGKKCEFSVGDKLYLKRTYYTPGGVSGYWLFQIENDSSVYYKLTDFQHDKKVLVESWFK